MRVPPEAAVAEDRGRATHASPLQNDHSRLFDLTAPRSRLDPSKRLGGSRSQRSVGSEVGLPHVELRPHASSSRVDAAAIWDLDGVLVDTAAAHYAAWREAVRSLGRDLTEQEFRATFGMRNPDILRYLFGKLSAAEVNRLSERKESSFRGMAGSHTSVLPGARELVLGLHAAGWRQAIGSSAPRSNVELVLQVTGLRPYFDALSTGDDVRQGKPDPEVFLIAARRLGVRPDRCVVLEDAPAGIEAAKAAGMAAIGVTNGLSGERLAAANLVVPDLSGLTVADLSALLREGTSRS